jgi:hypothetical protein
VQLRRFRQLEQALVAIEVFLILAFQQPGSRQLTIRQPQQSTRPTQEQAQGKSPQDAITDVQPDKVKQLRRRLVEFLG